MGKKETTSVQVVNRTYKNDFFEKIYEDEEAIAELSAKLFNMEATTVNVKKLKPILLGNKANDLSFLVDNVFVYLLEMQSSMNPNMAFRILHYIAAILLNLVDDKADIYGIDPILIKVPKLYTTFTGLVAEAPASIEAVQRLSDNFEIKQEKPDLEVVVHVFHFTMTDEEVRTYWEENILPERFKKYHGISLFEYALFVNSVQYKYKQIVKASDNEKLNAMNEVIELFKERGIFIKYFEDKEVVNMTLTHFSREMDLKYGGRAEGLEEGIKGSIHLLAGLGLNRQETLDKIMGQYSLSYSVAQRYVEKYFPN